VAPDHEVFDVENEVGDVFADTGDGVELVQRIIEAHLRDRSAGNARKQRPPKRVAQGMSEAGL